MFALLDVIVECVLFIVSVILALLFIILILLILFAPIAIIVLLFLIFTRKIQTIVQWDLFCDFHIIPILEKGIVIILFACFFATAGSYPDDMLDTSIAFSSLLGIVGAVTGFWFLHRM